MKPKVIAFLNSYAGRVSGGDIRFTEIARRMNDLDKIIVTSLLGKRFCEDKGLDAKYLITTKEKRVENVLLAYCKRMVLALFLKIPAKPCDILYSTSDFLLDVLPAFVHGVKSKNAWVANIYHIIPPPIQRPGPFITNFVSFLAQRLSFQLIKRRSDLIFVLNKGIVDQLAKLGFPKDKIYVTGAGVDLAHINQIPKIKEAEYDACFMGRLHPSKGIFDLIEIWKPVASKRGSSRLAIIYAGSEDLELALIERIREKNLESNVFMLPVTGDDALQTVKSGKIFIFPSHEEGWGIAVCEAMACGLPVVLYDLPVYREIFTQGIITVPLNDTKRFSTEVIDLLEDDEKRLALGEKAKAQASRYDWDNVARRELSLLKNI